MRKQGSIVSIPLQFIVRWIFAIFVIITFAALTSAFIIRDLDVSGVESVVIAERLFYAENTLGVEEAGIIRIGRFNQETFDRFKDNDFLDNAIVFPKNSHVSATITQDESIVWYQKFFVDIFEPLARRGVSGPGSARVVDWSVLVLNENNEAVVINAAVVIPNDEQSTI